MNPDTEPPSFVPPADFTVATNSGQAFATVSFPLPTNIRDNSGGMVDVTTSPANNSQLEIGPHIVQYTVTDSAGLFQTLPVTVTVIGESVLGNGQFCVFL